MDTILALVGLALLAVPLFTVIGLVSLWAKVGHQRRELAQWRSELWGVQRAGASLENRVGQLEHRVRLLPASNQLAREGGVGEPAYPAAVEERTAPTPPIGALPPKWSGPASADRDATSRSARDPVASAATSFESKLADGDTRDANPVLIARDANAPDSNAPDSNARDASAPDSNAPDSNAPDASVVDASAPESTIPDAPAPLPARKPIDLEQWLGVRGAAALGAAVLVLAGIYFFKYSIETDLLTTTMRVILGAAVAMAAIVGAEVWVRRRHELLANCLNGAGIAIFYITFWAAFARYELISGAVAGVLMVAVTVSSCVMAIKRSSLAIAALGLVGGFATPSMLSTGSDRPLALFGYLLLLDAALLFVAHRKRWPKLALLSLVGTSGYQGLWIVARMGPERLGWGMVLCAVFGAVFALAGERRGEGDDTADGLWRWTRAAALAMPMLLAGYLGMADLGATFHHVGALVFGLIVAAIFVSRRERWPELLQGTVAIGGMVVASWISRHDMSVDAWAICGFVVVVAVMLQTTAELEGEDRPQHGTSLGWTLGATLVTIAAVAYAPGAISPWPWMMTWLALALIQLRNGSLRGRETVILLSGTVLAAGLVLMGARQLAEAAGAELFLGFVVLITVVYQLATLLLSYPKARSVAGHATAVLPVAVLLIVPLANLRPATTMVATLALLSLTALATLRNGASLWLAAATGLAVLGQWWPWQLADQSNLDAPWGGPIEPVHITALIAHVATALLVAGWPLIATDRVRRNPWTWRNAALAPLVVALPIVTIGRRMWGQPATAFIAIAGGALTLTVLLIAKRVHVGEPAERRTRTAWLGGATLAAATAAIPLALEYEWVTIGWALLATALIALWRRVDHAGLRYVALGLHTVVFVRLAMVPNVVAYHDSVGMPVLNWLLYTYLIPVACLAVSGWLLRGHERARLRKWEPVTHEGEPVTPLLYGAAAIVLGFVWINVTIVDMFSVTSTIELTVDRMPARDLTMSISWAVYGLGLLCAGMWGRVGALRKASLGLILVTCGKVFLFDLAHLEDLYRVVSLTGLALSLIAVSLAYHHFVFRKSEQA